MRKPSGRTVVLQLLRAYQAEAELYDGLARAATEQHYLLRNGRDPNRLAEVVEHQRQLAEDIGKIESGIAPLREYWESIRDKVRGARVQTLAALLDQVLEDLADRIHAIIAVEQESSRELLAPTFDARI